MSKESSAGPLKFMRFPVRGMSKDEMELLRIDPESGHRIPRPRRSKTLRDHRRRGG